MKLETLVRGFLRKKLMLKDEDTVRRFFSAFVVVWLLDLVLVLLVFGIQSTLADSTASSMDGSTVPLRQVVAEFLNSITFAAPGAAFRSAVYMVVALSAGAMITRFFPRYPYGNYALAGATVPVVALALMDWRFHWISGLIGAIVLLPAIPLMRLRASL